MVKDKQRAGLIVSDVGMANHNLGTAIEITRQFRDAGLEHPTVGEASQFIGNQISAHQNTVKNKLYAAAKYMLLELRLNRETRLQEVFLSTLGAEILDPEQVRSAKVRAFLNVELNRTLYARYQDRPLPTDVELDRILVNDLGVVAKQRQHARRTFMRSAVEAGFFEQGRDRLNLPSDVPLPSDLLSTLNEIRSTQPMEEPLAQTEGANSALDLGMDETIASTPPQLPIVPSEKFVAPVTPTKAQAAIEEVIVPDPAIIAWWWQKKPRHDAPKTRWMDWHNTLGVILSLEFDGERIE